MPPRAYRRYIRQIRRRYARTTNITRRAGLAWYESEHQEIVRLARRTGYPIERVAACLAVLSPRCHWPHAKAACGKLLAGEETNGVFPHNLAKARAILAHGADHAIDPQTAPKTWAFWHNLWHPDDPEPVTLDAWMFRAHRLKINAGLATYRILAEAYRRAAEDLQLIPNQLQATIWLAAKVEGQRACTS